MRNADMLMDESGGALDYMDEDRWAGPSSQRFRNQMWEVKCMQA